MPDRHPCETCGTPTWPECRYCGPGCPVAPVEDQLTEEEKEAILAAEAAEAADEMR